MRNRLALVKNVVRLQEAYTALEGRDAGIPGMGLIYGFTGAGKTTSVAWLVNRVRGVYVRALSTWSPTAMLGAIMTELGAAPLGRSAPMVQYITQTLAASGRPLFIDESDYLLGNISMLETLRDIHDVAGVPVLLIGMEGIERRLIHRQQLARRISHWVEFLPMDLDDARVLADTICEVCVSDDLLHHLHQTASGSMGLMVVGLSRIEALARAQQWHSIDLKGWGNRSYFLSRPKTAGGR